jgi:hypothetical protein
VRSCPLSFLQNRNDPDVPALGKYPRPVQRQARPSQMALFQSSLGCRHTRRKHSYNAIPALPNSCDSQPIQSSKAAGSLDSQMARRRRRGESWRGALCGYLEMRKQKEHGGGRHMSARAEPQVGSGEQEVALRRAEQKRAGQGDIAVLLQGSSSWYKRAQMAAPSKRIWRCNPAPRVQR